MNGFRVLLVFDCFEFFFFVYIFIVDVKIFIKKIFRYVNYIYYFEKVLLFYFIIEYCI